jgi:type I site-specific restriction endonuclease
MQSPKELAREKIDALLTQCGWIIQNRSTINFSASRGVTVREALLKDRDEVDYLLFVDGKAIGTVEAKPEGHTLIGVEEQSGKYGKNLLDVYGKWRDPLPFAYESTGVETQFTNRLDPDPKSRNVFAFHKPETLLEWLNPEHQLNTRLANLLTTERYCYEAEVAAATPFATDDCAIPERAEEAVSPEESTTRRPSASTFTG